MSITVACKLVDGLMPSERIALIHSFDGKLEEVIVSMQNLRNDRLLANEIGRSQGKVLVELPRESASGRWRIWVEEVICRSVDGSYRSRNPSRDSE